MGESSSFIKVPSGKGIIVPFSVLAVLGTVFTFGQQVFSWYENKLAIHAQHILDDKDMHDRLERLERWQCRVGWNPPSSTDPNRDCSSAALKKRREE